MSNQCDKCTRKNCQMKKTSEGCELDKEQIESRWNGKDLVIRRRS